eukprot:TRINITY_DN7348_c0_g1_i1.p1 TRINITY_DN7348_c0_g1~~TRINITY_DN7348_c0_g1_i1.p1  ORF type:complete len:292 (+),score=92.47 TRINITY_DN7348_c0_g1_i1:55-876(+)
MPGGGSAPTFASRRAVKACVQFSECSLCLEPLCRKRVGVTVDTNGQRTCRHFYHFDCLADMVNFGPTDKALACPLCNCVYESVVQLPDPKQDAGKWFHYIDADNSGALSKEEIVDVVRAVCEVDEDDVEQIIDQKFKEWDKDGSHEVDKHEFKVVLAYIFDNLPAAPIMQDVPDVTLPDGLDAWFDHWDTDESGTLEKSELCRALLKTFDLGVKQERIANLQDVVHCVWPLFDPDRSDTITKQEFLMKDGLADTILAGLEVQKMLPDEDEGAA